MTENDYIAEYVKERHKDLLGFEYVMWRANRLAKELAQRLVSIFENVDLSKIVTARETEETKAESEEAADEQD